MTSRIAITPGEPAGIGPDLIAMLAQRGCDDELVVVADPNLLVERAEALNLPISTRLVDLDAAPQPLPAGEIAVLPISLNAPVQAGQLAEANARYVLNTLDAAIDGCLSGQFAALVTGPVQKSIINDAGVPFTGHTEYLQERCQRERVVMMLATEGLRVALATTHLPLIEVPGAITQPLLEEVITILHHDLVTDFGIPSPRIIVSGLNPHAGEGGHLGSEEIDTLIPVLERKRAEGINLAGPLPADTLFTPHNLEGCDAVLAMYHDQGLPVLKYKGFGRAVNVTLGLPFIRTSVDHGTALDLAGTRQCDPGSLFTALDYAASMVSNRNAAR